MHYELWNGDGLLGTTRLDWEREEPLICMGYLAGAEPAREALAALTDPVHPASSATLQLRRSDGTTIATRKIRLFDVAEILGAAHVRGIDDARPFDLSDDERFHIMVELLDARDVP